MTIFKYIAFVLLIAVIGTSIYISVQPNSYEVVRTRTINAPAEVLFGYIIDFKNWAEWSAWVEENPDMKITLDKQTKGIGGSYSWEDKHGIGTIKTTETVPNTLIKQKMMFEDFPSSDVTWTFKPNKNGTTDVVWAISGKDLSFGFKASIIFNGGMDKQIGPYYQRSLEKLELSLLKAMKKYTITVNGETNHSGGYYLYTTTSCKQSELENIIKNNHSKLINYAKKNNITLAGVPFVNYHTWDETNKTAIFSCGIPTVEQVITAEGDPIITGKFDNFKAIKTTLQGDHSYLKEAWKTTRKFITKNGFEILEKGPMLEAYLNNTKNTPNPANLRTEIYIAIKEKDSLLN